MFVIGGRRTPRPFAVNRRACCSEDEAYTPMPTMSPIASRLLGIFGALLLGALFLLLRPNAPSAEFLQQDGLPLSNIFMSILVMGFAIGFARWVLNVWAPRTASATELELTGAALSIMAAIFGALILAMSFLYVN